MHHTQTGKAQLQTTLLSLESFFLPNHNTGQKWKLTNKVQSQDYPDSTNYLLHDSAQFKIFFSFL